MKTQIASLLILLFTANGSFSSCGNISKPDQTWKFDSIQTKQTVHLFQDTTKPACNLAINIAYLSEAADSTTCNSLNRLFMEACLGKQYADMSPQEAVEAYTQQYVNDYRTDLEPIYLKEALESDENGFDIGNWYAYYENIDSHILTCTNQLLVYRIRQEEYTGGAHGTYMTYFSNIDLRTLQPIRLQDLFTDNYEEALTALLWEQLMADNDVRSRQELEDMGYGSTGELIPTENFYLSHKGVTFHYNIYEITPYVMGETEICLSWNILRSIKNEQFQIEL